MTPLLRPAERRVLVVAPTARDAEITQTILGEAGVASTVVGTLQAVPRELDAGAAALLLAEEVLAEGGVLSLAGFLFRQAPWSDLPVLLVTARGADSPLVTQAVEALGNVTLLERPTRVSALVSAVRTALRARDRQYQIREHVADRDRAGEALRQADRRKDEFLATLAHELRNPLAPIRNSLHVLRLTAADHPAVNEVCPIMERQVDHMVRLVDDLLEVSRITRDRIELRPTHVELAAVLRTAVEASRPLIDRAGHQLVVTIPSQTVSLEADGMRLAQVFANLLNNAAKYTRDGGHIWLTARRRKGWLIVSVRDDGIGIPPAMLDRIFDMFTQVRRSQSHVEGGLGIGLTLVRRLVEMHGGSVDAHSRGEGRGSRFVVRLPLARSESPSPSPAPRAAETAARDPLRRRILVVDDNHDAAESLGMLLRRIGGDVHVVHDGPSALAELDRYHPDAVLLDLGMPEMDGFTVARRIRERPDCRDLLLIALTGWGQEEDRRRTRSAGFDHHLTKPADLHALQALLA